MKTVVDDRIMSRSTIGIIACFNFVFTVKSFPCKTKGDFKIMLKSYLWEMDCKMENVSFLSTTSLIMTDSCFSQRHLFENERKRLGENLNSVHFHFSMPIAVTLPTVSDVIRSPLLAFFSPTLKVAWMSDPRYAIRIMCGVHFRTKSTRERHESNSSTLYL